MERTAYREPLAELERTCAEIALSGRLGRFLVVSEFAVLVLRWERHMVNRDLTVHPFELVTQLITEAASSLERRKEILAFGGRDQQSLHAPAMEEFHQELFQSLWVKYSEQDYLDRIQQYVDRIRLNGLDDVVQGARCIDFGSGHGNFAHALIRSGAASVVGIDYGEANIEYSERAARRLAEERVSFRCVSVYATDEPSGAYDFAVQNGVFHHLDDEARAYREVHRVLRSGGHFWVYTDGSDSIQGDLQDAAARVVGTFPISEVNASLEVMGLSVGKRYHLGDSLQATYRHTTPEHLVEFLGELGFSFVRRLAGGSDTDSDGSSLLLDRWAEEKFGTGDIRMLFVKD